MTSVQFPKQFGKLGKGKGCMMSKYWLLYFPLKSPAICFSCLLFSSKNAFRNCSYLEAESDLNNWKKSEQITIHDNPVGTEIISQLGNKWKEA